MSNLYSDRRITCTEDAIVIDRYYLWGGEKTIPYSDIQSVEHVELTMLRGKYRLWGTADPRYWANLDAGRPHKSAGLILELGRSVRPLITPDDVAAVEAIIQERGDVGEIVDAGGAPCM